MTEQKKYFSIKRNLTSILLSSELNPELLCSIDSSIRYFNFKSKIKTMQIFNWMTNSKLFCSTEKLYFCDDLKISPDFTLKIPSSDTLIIGSFRYNREEYYYLGRLVKINNLQNDIDIWFGNNINAILNIIPEKKLLALNDWFKARIIGILTPNEYFRIFDDKLDNYIITYVSLSFYFDDYKNKCLTYKYNSNETIKDFEESNDIYY